MGILTSNQSVMSSTAMCVMFKSHGMRPKPFSDVNVRSVGRCIVA